MKTSRKRIGLFVAAMTVAWFVAAIDPALAQNLQLDPQMGPAGSPVNAGGCGWQPGQNIQIFFGVDGNGFGGQFVAEQQALSDGCFGTTFTVPNKPPGVYRVKACQACDQPSELKSPLVPFEITEEPTSPPPSSTPPPSTTALPDFTVSCLPSSLAAQPGGSAPSTCTVKSQGGFNKPVSLTCADQPVGTACGFNPSTVTPRPNGSVNSALTVNVLGDAEPGQFNFQVVGTSGTVKHNSAIKLVIAIGPITTLTEVPPGPVVTPTGGERLELDRPSTEPGGEATATGKGCDPESEVEVSVANRHAGDGTADEVGDFEVPIKIPDDVGVGRHQVIAECGATIETTVDVVVFARAESPGAPMAVLAVLIFFMLEVRRMLRREGAVSPRR